MRPSGSVPLPELAAGSTFGMTTRPLIYRTWKVCGGCFPSSGRRTSFIAALRFACLARDRHPAESPQVMPYSTGCTTPISNFEAGLNFKDVPDPAVVVAFPLVADPHTAFLAFTTTPWTLPSNLALCMHPDF